MSFDGDINIKNIFLTFANSKTEVKAKAFIDTTNTNFRLTEKTPINLSGKLDITIGSFVKLNKNTHLSCDIQMKDAHVQYADDFTIHGFVKASKTSYTKNNGHLRIHGNLSIADSLIEKDTKSVLRGNISLTDTTLELKDHTLVLDSQVDIANAQIHLDKDKKIFGNLNADKFILSSHADKLKIQSTFKIKEANLKLPANIEYNGDPDIDLTFEHLTSTGESLFSGNLTVEDSSLKGLRFIDELNQIKGTASFDQEKIAADKISFMADDTSLLLSGTLKDYSEPNLDIMLSSEHFKLDLINKHLKSFSEKYGIELTGASAFQAKYKGLISDLLETPLETSISASAILKDSTVNFTKTDKSVSLINGKLTFNKDSLSWEELSAKYAGTDYALHGVLNDFSRPVVDTTVSSEHLTFSSQIKILRRAIQFIFLKGNYYNSEFDIFGDAHFPVDLPVDLDLRGKVDFNLEDLSLPAFQLKEKITAINPKGKILLDGLFRGNLKDWRSWQLTFDASSPNIILYDFSFDNISMTFVQRDNYISKMNISSKIYNGDFNVESSVDLSSDELPFKLKAKMEHIDLAKFRQAKDIKIVGLKGDFYLITELKSFIKDIKKINGKGAFSVKNGFLGEIEIVKGILKAFKKVPGFFSVFALQTSIVQEQTAKASKATKNYITGALGGFTLAEQKISFENISVLGSLYDLKLAGWLDFDRQVEIMAFPDGSRYAGKYSYASDFLGSPMSIKITGEIGNFKYEPIVDPVQPLKNAVDTTLDLGGDAFKILGDVFGNIFE